VQLARKHNFLYFACNKQSLSIVCVKWHSRYVYIPITKRGLFLWYSESANVDCFYFSHSVLHNSKT
jgi:hypothetical protein